MTEPERDVAVILCNTYQEATEHAFGDVFPGAGILCAEGCGTELFITNDILSRTAAAGLEPHPVCMACLILMNEDIEYEGVMPGQVEAAANKTGQSEESLNTAAQTLTKLIKHLRMHRN